MATYENFGGGSDVAHYEQPRMSAQGVQIYSGRPQQSLRLNIVFGLGMIFSIALCAFASNEWGYQDLNGLCKLLNSEGQYLPEFNDVANGWGCQAKVSGACPTPSKENARAFDATKPCCYIGVYATSETCTAKNNIFSMPECLKKVCNKSENIEFGQCKAPVMGMWGGSLGVFTVVAGFLACYFQAGSMQAKGANVACSVLAIVACGVSLACFFWSFYRFGSGNVDDRSNFAMDGNTFGPDCNYNYPDSPQDYKTMTAFACLTALWSVLVAVMVCLVVYGNQALLAEKQNLTDGLATPMATDNNA